MTTLIERFESKWVRDPSTGCYVWQAYRDKDGYGTFRVGQHKRRACRVSYELYVGPIPDLLMIDHLCRNRACVCPLHLEPVTGRTNTLRGVSITAINAKKQMCPQRHEYTPENTRIYQGKRHCRACDRDRMRTRRSTA